MKLVIRRETISASEVRIIVGVEMSDDEVLKFRGKYVYIPYLAQEVAATLPRALQIDCDREKAPEIEDRIIEELRESFLELKLAMYEDERYSRVAQL